MSIDQLDRIDLISTTDDEQVRLTIADHLEWDEEGEHHHLLEEKIIAYLEFIEGGQIYVEYPKAKTSEVIISVKLKFNPDKMGVEFLNRCKDALFKLEIGFDWEVLTELE
jgi:hypothetical protein